MFLTRTRRPLQNLRAVRRDAAGGAGGGGAPGPGGDGGEQGQDEVALWPAQSTAELRLLRPEEAERDRVLLGLDQVASVEREQRGQRKRVALRLQQEPQRGRVKKRRLRDMSDLGSSRPCSKASS